MKKTIYVDVFDDGEVKIQTENFTGKTCVNETEFLKKILGEEVFRQLTPAFYAQTENQTIKRYLPLCG